MQPFTRPVDQLDFIRDRRTDLRRPAGTSTIEYPLLDPLRFNQPNSYEQSHMLAQGRLTDAELFGDEYPANAVAHQIAFRLGREI